MRRVVKIVVSFMLTVAATAALFSGKQMNSVVSKNVSAEQKKRPVIVIDAGHGGIDSGAVADGTLEKDINLDIALKLRDFCHLLGMETVMIREDDVSIHDSSAKTIRQKKVSDLKNRLKIANKSDNRILVSIHQNIYSGSDSFGTQVFFSAGNEKSEKLAETIQLQIKSQLQPENKRKIKKAGDSLFILFNSKVPAVMVECGFMSNRADLQKLSDEIYRSKLSFLIAVSLLHEFGVKI